MTPLPFSCTLIRSRRKTVAIEVTPDGQVLVRAPMRLPAAAVESFLDAHRAWVAQKLQQAAARAQAKIPLRAQAGGQLLYLGRLCPVKEAPDGRARFENGTFYLPAAGGPSAAEALLRRLAREGMQERAALYAPSVGVTPAGLRITDARTRWGSCSAAGRLCFSYRLLFAPPAAVDYVAVHELCHLRALNHSPDFWKTVAAVLPDYRDRARQLRQLEQTYDLTLV